LKTVNAVKCGQVRRLLTAYGDGELDARRSAEVADHLRSCAACQADAADLAASLTSFRALAREAGWAPPRARLAAEICLATARRSGRRGNPQFASLAAAAALVLAVLATLMLASRHPRRMPTAVATSPAVHQPAAPSGTAPRTRSEFALAVIFEARLAAAEAAMVPPAQPEPMPEVCLTASEVYSQIPAIMLVAADQVKDAASDRQEAARMYRRIVQLFPGSKEARIAAERLAPPRQERKES
jgi:anti-sigma factor RsiW